jgi:nicotinamidase-related amidase
MRSEGQLLTPDNHTLILVDHESQMALAVASHPIEMVINATTGLAKAAKLFNVPTIVTTVSERSFSGPLFRGIREIFPNHSEYIDRTTMNPWEDDAVLTKVRAYSRHRLVFAGLWTEVCVVLPVISAMQDDYHCYVITDACGGVSAEAHERAVQRMIQAGAIPMTWMQYMLELQRDWTRSDTAAQVGAIAKEHGGAYGLGIEYLYQMKEWAKEQ